MLEAICTVFMLYLTLVAFADVVAAEKDLA